MAACGLSHCAQVQVDVLLGNPRPCILGRMARPSLVGDAESTLIGVAEQEGDLLEGELFFRDVPARQLAPQAPPAKFGTNWKELASSQ